MSHAGDTVAGRAGRRRDAASLHCPQSRAGLYVLDPEGLYRHIDHLYRAAWALCGSQHDAEDLVQETFLNVLKRPRVLRDGSEIGYLLRALRNTYSSRYRSSAHRWRDRALSEYDAAAAHETGFETRALMEAIPTLQPPTAMPLSPST